MHRDCLFCGIARGEVPSYRVAETPGALAFLDIRPLRPGHTLVIPRSHAEDLRDLRPSDWQAVTQLGHWVAQRFLETLSADGVNLFLASGVAADQTVFHAHLHVIPRHTGDALDLRTWWESRARPAGPAELAEMAHRLAGSAPGEGSRPRTGHGSGSDP